MKARATIAALVASIIYLAGQDSHADPRADFTAAKYTTLPDLYRGMYVLGVVGGMEVSETFSVNGVTPALAHCLYNRSGEQEVAVVDRYVQSHPDLSQELMPLLILLSFREICPEFDAAFRRAQAMR